MFYSRYDSVKYGGGLRMLTNIRANVSGDLSRWIRGDMIGSESVARVRSRGGACAAASVRDGRGAAHRASRPTSGLRCNTHSGTSRCYVHL